MPNPHEPVTRHVVDTMSFMTNRMLPSEVEVVLAADYDRDIKALLGMIDEFQCTRDSNEFDANLLLRADAALKTTE